VKDRGAIDGTLAGFGVDDSLVKTVRSLSMPRSNIEGAFGLTRFAEPVSMRPKKGVARSVLEKGD